MVFASRYLNDENRRGNGFESGHVRSKALDDLVKERRLAVFRLDRREDGDVVGSENDGEDRLRRDDRHQQKDVLQRRTRGKKGKEKGKIRPALKKERERGQGGKRKGDKSKCKKK